jgi:nucleotide-binding universal stress UspA family protein
MSFTANNIVVPIDFSTASEKAIRTALDMAADRSAIHLIHVLYPLDAVSPGVVWGDVNDAKREEAVRKTFDAFIKQHACEGVNIVVRFGHPGEEIVDHAEESGSDLIIVPSHGHHGMKRFVLGSVAEKIIRHAKCPVLVLPCNSGK